MVVASAAGSLFDMKNQANLEGFSIKDYEDYISKYGKPLIQQKKKAKRGRKPKNKLNESQIIQPSDYEEEEEEEEEEEDEEDIHDMSNKEDLQDYIDYALNIDTTNAYDNYDDENPQIKVQNF
ncbi:hypothetical protein QCA50_009895 [Cerrena zonata]|uniref:Uncharacterized protein n=1 Tax=Cerrena zonata TaxID=2478898 RepID=A0AAW0G030_9APHY